MIVFPCWASCFSTSFDYQRGIGVEAVERLV